MQKKILYITYDGLTDPLGQSQILPYLKGLAKHGYQFTILSFEKKDRYLREKNLIKDLTDESGIRWYPLFFTSNPPMLSKFYDVLQMRRKAIALQKQNKFDMVHCRSYIAADVGLLLKKKFGIKFFFDMRGFWADEKKDGGSWDVSNPIYKRVYHYFKQKEKQYIENADYIVSLTEAGKKEMSKWDYFKTSTSLKVIPCCADMEHFSVTSLEQKKRSKENLGLKSEDLLVSYLGSIGTWYMLDEMLLLFKKIKLKYSSAKFLFVTHTIRSIVDKKIIELGLLPEDFIVLEASRKEVPLLIKASDINISFIKPVYSKISSSPTKLGEVLSMGIPVICNSGVGDVKEIVENADAGIVINKFNQEEYDWVIKEIPRLLLKDPKAIRNAVADIFSLDKGIKKYAECYQQIFTKNGN